MQCPPCFIESITGVRPGLFGICSECPEKVRLGHKYCKTCSVTKVVCVQCGNSIEEGNTYRERLEAIIAKFQKWAKEDPMYVDMLPVLQIQVDSVVGKPKEDVLAFCKSKMR